MSNYEGFGPSEAFPEPSTDRIELIAVLKALADPVRLHIVQRLADEHYHSCSVQEYGLDIHKSTLSHHFRTLREAGVTSTAVKGREHAVKLRKEELDRRFPGVLSSILLAHRALSS
jgi:DNA-binding transcriptional ArsR family regulator